MQEFFGDRAILCTITGKTSEKVLFRRASKSHSTYLENFVSNALLEDNTALVNGDLVNDGTNSYFVTARRNGTVSKVGQLVKTNGEVKVVRLDKKYNAAHVFTGYQEIVIASTVTNYREVTGAMRQYDPGLLPTTTIKFIVPKVAMQLHDRISLTGGTTNYTVDFIDSTSCVGLLTLQCSPDDGKAAT